MTCRENTSTSGRDALASRAPTMGRTHQVLAKYLGEDEFHTRTSLLEDGGACVTGDTFHPVRSHCWQSHTRLSHSNGGADCLRAQRHVQLEKVAAQLKFLPGSVDGLLHSKVWPEDETHGGFSHGLRAEANCVRVWAVFQQGYVELHGDVVSRGHLVLPGAAKELRSLRIPLRFLSKKVPERHHKASLHLPDVHSSIQLRAQVHEEIHALQPSFTRHHVEQNLGHRGTVHGVDGLRG
mmetsp:Transcript_16048/g.43634  ORF Transcript_16048/g.43634 Transcript_16048/m.43634 type:complete len:237 (-) Transcript_16048:3735-4445(-)